MFKKFIIKSQNFQARWTGEIKHRDFSHDSHKNDKIAINIDSPVVELIDYVAITAMIVTCLVAPVTFLRAKIVGQYELHDPLKSGAMVSIIRVVHDDASQDFLPRGSVRFASYAITYESFILWSRTTSLEQLAHPLSLRTSLTRERHEFYYRGRCVLLFRRFEKKAHWHAVNDLRYRIVYVIFFKDVSIIIYRLLKALCILIKRGSFY